MRKSLENKREASREGRMKNRVPESRAALIAKVARGVERRVGLLLLLLQRYPARHSAVDVAPAAHRVRWVQVHEGRLFEEAHGQVELFRDALGRHVAVPGPHDVLDVQSVVLLLVAVPHADLAIQKER